MDLSLRNESSAHFDAKKRIAAAAIAAQRLTFAVETFDGYRMARLDTAGMRTVIECDEVGNEVPDPEDFAARTGHWPVMIFDVGFVRDGRVLAAVEVVRGHGLTERKRTNIARYGVLCVVVKATPDEWARTGIIEAIEVIAPARATVLLEEVRP